MREQHDGTAPGAARAPSDDGGERALAVDRLRLQMTGVHREARGGAATEATQRLCDVGGEGFIALTTRPALGKLGGEALQFGESARTVKRVRSERRGERVRRCPQGKAGYRESE